MGTENKKIVPTGQSDRLKLASQATYISNSMKIWKIFHRVRALEGESKYHLLSRISVAALQLRKSGVLITFKREKIISNTLN